MTAASNGKDAAGGYSRRGLLKIGIGVVAGVGMVGPAAGTAMAGGPGDPSSPTLAVKVKNLSGPAETGPFTAPWTDLGIPVRCPDGTMLFVGGDTFDGDHVPRPGEPSDWRAPVGLRSSNGDVNNLRID
ncbi:DUF4185 domain-containing protein, partial [Streptomyces sp. NPDC001274]